MSNKINKGEYLVTITFLGIIWLFGVIIGYDEGKEALTHQLCSKQQYDFCVVHTKVRYSLKEEK